MILAPADAILALHNPLGPFHGPLMTLRSLRIKQFAQTPELTALRLTHRALIRPRALEIREWKVGDLHERNRHSESSSQNASGEVSSVGSTQK